MSVDGVEGTPSWAWMCRAPALAWHSRLPSHAQLEPWTQAPITRSVGALDPGELWPCFTITHTHIHIHTHAFPYIHHTLEHEFRLKPAQREESGAWHNPTTCFSAQTGLEGRLPNSDTASEECVAGLCISCSPAPWYSARTKRLLLGLTI